MTTTSNANCKRHPDRRRTTNLGRPQSQFPDYINSLGLKNSDGTALTLNADGSGSFRDHVAGYIARSAEAALKSGQTTAEKLAAEHPWLTLDGGRVTAVDFAAYAQAAGR